MIATLPKCNMPSCKNKAATRDDKGVLLCAAHEIQKMNNKARDLHKELT